MTRAELKQKVRTFPDSPGVYIMLDNQGHEIYIGKAKSLRKRVGSYFRDRLKLETKTMVLMDNVNDVDFVPTDSEVEALLLESRLIKSDKPKYNIELKWNDRYPVLLILEADDFARILITRKQELIQDQKAALYMSRFTAVSDLRAGLDVLQKIFRFRTCSLDIRENDGRRRYARPCLLYHIKRCSAPCAARISQKAYREDINHFIRFLEGDKEELIAELEKNMQAYSEARKYEGAARLRDEWQLLQAIGESGGMLEGDIVDVPIVTPEESLAALENKLKLIRAPIRIEGIDISHTSGAQSVGSLVTFLNGMPFKEGYRRFRIKTRAGVDDTGMIAEVVTRRISRLLKEGQELPDLLLIDGGKGQVAAAAAALQALNASEVFAVGLAKGREILYPAGRKRGLRLSANSPGLKLLCYVRDESHRFAGLYHRLLRSKKMLGDAKKGKGRKTKKE
ncbi:GIY-YIG nuclease family protein [Planctomycetota bacterium]